MADPDTPRLDKEHGFMKFIVQNQISRDEYEQEQRVAEYKKKTNGSGKKKTKKQSDREIYSPRKRIAKKSDKVKDVKVGGNKLESGHGKNLNGKESQTPVAQDKELKDNDSE